MFEVTPGTAPAIRAAVDISMLQPVQYVDGRILKDRLVAFVCDRGEKDAMKTGVNLVVW